MKKSPLIDAIEKTIDFLERAASDKLAYHYLQFALSSFAQGHEEQLSSYLVRYDIQRHRLPPESAQLLIIGQKQEVACFILEPYANLIGRLDPQTRSYPNIDLTAFDLNAKISRRHAKIYSIDGRNFWLEDLNSFNGTALNNVPIAPHQPNPLHDGDEILFGNTAATFTSPIAGKKSNKRSSDERTNKPGLQQPAIKTQGNEPIADKLERKPNS